MSNNRAVKRIRKNAVAALQAEALAREIPPGTRAYLVWLKLQRDFGLTMDEAAAQIDAWDEEAAERE